MSEWRQDLIRKSKELEFLAPDGERIRTTIIPDWKQSEVYPNMYTKLVESFGTDLYSIMQAYYLKGCKIADTSLSHHFTYQVLHGKLLVNGNEVEGGDFFIIEKQKSIVIQALEDTHVLLTIRPALPGITHL